MRKIFEDDYLDNARDAAEADMRDEMGYDGIELEDPEEIDIEDDKDIDDDEDEVYYEYELDDDPKTLLSALRNELKLKEYERSSLLFQKDGEELEGVPMLEINPNKFVFKILPEGKLRSIVLSDIVLIDVDE